MSSVFSKLIDFFIFYIKLLKMSLLYCLLVII
nr:MAG TPA: hypothetical protein [Caudoviricetes sp.]